VRNELDDADGAARDVENGSGLGGHRGHGRGVPRRTVLAATAGAAVVAGAVGGGPTAQAAPARRTGHAAVSGLTVEHRTDPLGVDAARPRFG